VVVAGVMGALRVTIVRADSRRVEYFTVPNLGGRRHGPCSSGASQPSAGTRESLASTSSALTPICDEVGERAM